MKQRRFNATLAIAALALTILLILTALPLASAVIPRLEQQPLELLTGLNDTEATERGAPSAASVVQSPGTTTRVSVASDGTQGNGRSYDSSISADGRYVAFTSIASNLVLGDTNGCSDVFVHDRETGRTDRVSVASDGTQGNGGSYNPSISADGRYVAFTSYASSLVPGDTNGKRDIFVHDRVTGQTHRVSVASDGTQGNDRSERPFISADGRFVAFSSWASNLVPDDTNNTCDVFLHDRVTGQTSRVSVASEGTQANGGCCPSISADGRFVAFDSGASDLVPGDTNNTLDVFVHDRLTGQTTRVSVASDGTQGNGWSGWSSISVNGRFVAFESEANNLVPGDTNGKRDIFIHDRVTGQTQRVSVASDGTEGNGDSCYPSISADGRFVAFDSEASNLVPGDTNGKRDIFIHDRVTGQTQRISVASDGTEGNHNSWVPSISADGRYVAFESDARNLVPGDTNGCRDIFVHDRGITPPLTKPPVVLVHGWQGLGSATRRCSEGISRPWPGVPNTFGDMVTWLQNDGFDVWIAHLDTGPGGTPRLEANAWGPGCLKDQIAYVKQQTGARQVILIAHSMGGLVSRAYIEGPEYESDVQVLFTLGSPHAGMPIDSIKDALPDWFESYCGNDDQDDGQKAVCQMSEVSMYIWNRVYGLISHGVTPPYYLIGGDKSDSILGEILKSCGVDPNDGCVGTRTAQAGTDNSPAIQSDVRGRYQTHETHSSSKWLGYPSYFQPPSGQVHSQSYQCIQNVLLGTSNPCAGPSSASLSAQAAPSLTGHTSDARGHLNTGETAEHILQVDTDGASIFYLSWVTGTLGLTLTNPVGTVIDPAYADTHTDVVTYTTSPGSEMTRPFAAYAFTTTVPGLYTATITAGDVGITGTDYLLFAAMETTRTLSVALDSDHYPIGDTAVLTATLEGAGGGITGATVQATFSRSDAITDTLALTDQGDGTYRGIYAIPNAPGYLHLRVTAEGSDAGTQFNRQVDRLLTVASQAVQLTGTYADCADDADGNGRYETLTVDVEVLAARAGDFTFSADLMAGGDQFVAHVITQTALITGTQSVPLRFDGELIQDGGSDGPFTVTNLLISDLQNAGIPSVMADDVWTTAAYDHTQFGRITGDMNGDCIVTVVDIMLVASRWGTNIGDIRYDAAYDLDDSGNIDIVDIMIVATHWRERCE